MKLIPRRKKEPTPLERAAGYAKLGAKGLATQRAVRVGLKRYRFTKRLLQLTGLAALGAFVAKKLGGGGGGGDAASTTSYSTSSSTPASSSGTSAGTAATAATGTPPADEGAGSAPPATDVAPPSDEPEAAAPGVGDEQPSTSDDEPSAGEDGGETTTEWLPPADASGTEEELGIEGPNQSTPPPPEGTTK